MAVGVSDGRLVAVAVAVGGATGGAGTIVGGTDVAVDVSAGGDGVAVSVLVGGAGAVVALGMGGAVAVAGGMVSEACGSGVGVASAVMIGWGRLFWVSTRAAWGPV